MAGRMRSAVQGLLLLVIVCASMIVASAPASANAVLVSTTPGDGDLVATAPGQVRMTFSEPIEAGLATVRLFDPYGEQAQTAPPANAEGSDHTLTVPMPAQTFMGTYTVAWRVLSGDAHPVLGAFTFHVGTPLTSASPPSPLIAEETDAAAGLLYNIARLLAFAALALLVGLTFFVAAWWPEAGRYPAMGRLIWGSWAVLVLSTIAVLLLFGPQATGRPLSAVADPALLSTTIDTRVGMAMLGRLLVLALAAPAIALLLVRTRPPSSRQRGWRIGAVLGAAVALAATWSMAGHSAVGRHTAIALPVDVVHLVAMGVWLGGLVALCGVLLRSQDVVAMRSAVPSFSRAAVVCVVLLVLTGLYQGWRQVGSPAALTSTSYGQLLVGKVLLVAVLVGIGAASRSWVRRHYQSKALSSAARRRARRGPGAVELGRFRRIVAAETGLAAVVLGVTAALVASQPARSAQIEAASQQRAEQRWADATSAPSTAPPPAPALPATTRIGFDAGGPGGKGAVDLAIFPGTVGRNELHLTVLDASGALLAVADVTATMSGPEGSPLAVPLQQLAPGHYIGAATVPSPGTWELAVDVRTSEVDRATVTTPVEVR